MSNEKSLFDNIDSIKSDLSELKEICIALLETSRRLYDTIINEDNYEPF